MVVITRSEIWEVHDNGDAKNLVAEESQSVEAFSEWLQRMRSEATAGSYVGGSGHDVLGDGKGTWDDLEQDSGRDC